MPDLELIFSHRMEKLFDSFAEAIRKPAAGMGLLTAETVLLDNRVLGEWLNIQLAQKHDVAANVRYLQPSALFWQLARALLPEEASIEAPLSKAEMSWKLYSLFDDDKLMALPVLQPVASYLDDEDCRPLKRYQLAVAIADLFDQYLIYRPDWLLAWQCHEINLVEDANEAWQAELWRQLAGPADDSLSHRAIIEQKLHDFLKENNSKAVGERLALMRLSVFGITTLSPQMVKLLILLAQHIPVRLYVLNPCREYWELIASAKSLARQKKLDAAEELYYEIGNPLLASQGEQLREFIQLLQENADADFIDTDEAAPQTLLQQIQHDILTLSYKGQPAAVDYVSDGEKQMPAEKLDNRQHIPSVHIHRCHGPQREVEVLHEQLRDMLDKMPGLNPRDIVVMMPRVSTYAPYIHAVFTRDAEHQRIPYRINDQTLAEQSPLLTSFDTLLNLADGRFTLSEVLSILEVPAVQKAFAMQHEDFETLRSWLSESGVRWGIDAAHRAQQGLPAYYEHSWSFGLDRLLSGYAMAVDESNPKAALLQPSSGVDVLPYDEIEGGKAAILDSFLHIWQKMEQLAKSYRRSRKLEDWYRELLQLLDNFYIAENDEDREAMTALREAITTLGHVADKQWCQDEVAIDVVRSALKPVMEQNATGRHHWQEGVKFCSLLPMRAVPFRVVYILGMNLEDYPRRLERKGFDLMRKKRRAGDRASRIDDRWLFLEALLSARDVFHASYNARDMHRNESREPSVVLSELIDYLHHGYELDENKLFTDHPLQPFSDSYFLQDKAGLSPRLLSFDQQSYAIAAARRQHHKEMREGLRWQSQAPESPAEEISTCLDSFSRFFCKPWLWFFSERHKTRLGIDSDKVQDEENFDEGGGLKKWQLRDELIRTVNCSNDSTEYQELIDKLEVLHKATADWPLGSAGSSLKQSLLEDEKTKDYLFASAGLEPVAEHIDIAIASRKGKLRITGDVTLYRDETGYRYILHSPGKRSIDKELAYAIQVAVLKAAENINLVGAEAVYYDDTKKRQKADQLDAEALAKLDYKTFLDVLAELFICYQGSGLPFEPAWSFDVYENGQQQNPLEQFDVAEQADIYWADNIQGDIAKRCYFVITDAIRSSEFCRVSTSIWQAFYTRIAGDEEQV